MTSSSIDLSSFESKIVSGAPLNRAEAERLLNSPDLVGLGMLGESARQARSGDRVTYVRVAIVVDDLPAERAEAGEVRLAGTPASVDEARSRVQAVVPFAAGATLTGFSLADLRQLTGGDRAVLAELAAALVADGLHAVAAVPIDQLGDAEEAIETIGAVTRAGLGAWRATVTRAGFDERLDLIECAAAVQQATNAFQVFAPLPELDPADAPSTGYDDVRTVALARLCTTIPAIQVSWPLYGPKLAQVAIAYGAGDIDAVSPVDIVTLGHRRSPRADIERQIRAAGAMPVERTGRFELLS